MQPKALEELYNISKIEGISREFGNKAREDALKEWVSRWVVEVSTSQSVIKASLSVEEQDYLKYHLAMQLGDELMESCVQVESQPNRITTKTYAIRR